MFVMDIQTLMLALSYWSKPAREEDQDRLLSSTDTDWVPCVKLACATNVPADAGCSVCAQALREDVYCCGQCPTAAYYHPQCWRLLRTPVCPTCGGHMVE